MRTAVFGTWLVLVRVGVTATCTRDPGATSSSLIVMMGWSRWWCTATCAATWSFRGIVNQQIAFYFMHKSELQ